jgi:hypothetical protein
VIEFSGKIWHIAGGSSFLRAPKYENYDVNARRSYTLIVNREIIKKLKLHVVTYVDVATV